MIPFQVIHINWARHFNVSERNEKDNIEWTMLNEWMNEWKVYYLKQENAFMNDNSNGFDWVGKSAHQVLVVIAWKL